MHPNPSFRARAGADPLTFVEAVGFAHIMVATQDGPMVVHAPLTRAGDRVRFHVARGNRAARRLDGAAVLLSVAGAQGYVSPSWYTEAGDQVPTWNYVAVEIDGVARAIDEAALVDQLDRLAAVHEPRVAPEQPWTRAKLSAVALRKLLGAIVGFEVAPDAIRVTAKLSQNKPVADREGVIAGLRRSGDGALADAMAAG